jgi:hypothetical protein
MKITKFEYIAYISSNKETQAFAKYTGMTIKQVIYKAKRNNKEWRDCIIWVTDKYGQKIFLNVAKNEWAGLV